MDSILKLNRKIKTKNTITYITLKLILFVKESNKKSHKLRKVLKYIKPTKIRYTENIKNIYCKRAKKSYNIKRYKIGI